MDNRFILLLCLLLGFSIWWHFIPLGLVDSYDINPLNANLIEPFKVIFIEKSQSMKDLYINAEQRMAVKQFIEGVKSLQAGMEKWEHPDYDPLNLPSDRYREMQPEPDPVVQARRAKTLAILMGAIYLMFNP